jgi:predicted dehydrogenase
MKRKIRMGMIGGGQGSFIGAVHRMAANLDGQIELVCGAFSSNPERSETSGKELFLPSDRIYSNYREMILKEKNLPLGKRMNFVAIVTPNHLHFDPAKLALENGFHVICDKPVTFNLEEAEELGKIVSESNLLFALTHTYTGYPMVKEARNIVQSNKLGNIRKVIVEYPQGWLSQPIESEDQKQAAWRTDPAKSGISCCMGDIGTHAENLAHYITGLKISELSADLTTFVDGRLLDDDGSVLLRFENGAKGVLQASQISAGEENNINIKVYAEKGGLEWHQKDSNTLLLKWLDKPVEILRAGTNLQNLSEAALFNCRVPAGHPEGYIEAFANIYKNFALTINCLLSSERPNALYLDFPTINDGIEGMKFVNAVVESSNNNCNWIKF